MLFTRTQFFFFIGVLISGYWPTLLQADTLKPIPKAATSSSFLLVASKQMLDQRFHQTVLLVSRHGNTGPIGIIINRPQNITLDKLFPEYPAAKDFNLFFGGPVFTKQISFLVRGSELVSGALPVSSDIYLAYDMLVLNELLSGKRPYRNLRVMHGLASWAPGQLEYEINQGDWLVLPIDEAVIFDHPPAGMWQELFNRANSVEL